MEFSAVILAGGRSSRMQRDKAFLPCRGTTLLAWQLELARGLGPTEIFISGRADADYGALGLPVLLDRFADLGPLAGVERALGESRSPSLLVLAVDLPDMTAEFLRGLAAHRRADRGVVPRTGLGLEPLAAFYPKAMLPIATAVLAGGHPAMTEFVRRGVEAGLVDECACPPEDEACFVNWNGPEDVGPERRSGAD